MSKVDRNDFRPVEGRRTHANCKSQTGVARPGKTAADKASGAWASKGERNSNHAARREALTSRRR